MINKNKADTPLLLKALFLLAGIIAGSVIMHFVLIIMPVKSTSMEPALNKDDYVLINRFSSTDKGDIAVYKSPIEEGRMLISRIAGREYDTVELRDRMVYINNEPLIMASSHIDASIFPMKFSYRDNMPPVKLKRGEFFMLNDNFNSSFDSRNFGPVNIKNISGKVIYKK